MNNLDVSGTGGGGLKGQIPLDDSAEDTKISHSPLNLGGGSGGAGAVEAPKVETPPATAAPAAAKPAEAAACSERITGIRTFFTKLHAGAITFLDEQITNWLKNNPGVVIKRTNMITGEIQGKKTEPNIVITIWY